MDYGAIIKKSWYYASKMRYLWGIGLLVALTEGAGGGYGGGYNIFPQISTGVRDYLGLIITSFFSIIVVHIINWLISLIFAVFCIPL